MKGKQSKEEREVKELSVFKIIIIMQRLKEIVFGPMSMPQNEKQFMVMFCTQGRVSLTTHPVSTNLAPGVHVQEVKQTVDEHRIRSYRV